MVVHIGQKVGDLIEAAFLVGRNIVDDPVGTMYPWTPKCIEAEIFLECRTYRTEG